MKTPTVLVAPGTIAPGTTVELDEAERHHLRVRRVAANAEVLVLDGAGTAARGVIGDRAAVVHIGVMQHRPQPAQTLLAVGAGDKERFLLLAERCTELAVTQLVPLLTERSRAVDGRFRDAALDRARRRAREACKQSENAWATVVADSCPLAELASRFPGMRWLLADVAGDACPPLAPGQAVGWIIGPEGGLSPVEREFALARLPATTVRLGAPMLRFDTAAVVAAALTHDRRTATKE